MRYKVIEDFTDLQDNMYNYTMGMTYPRAGYNPTEKRIMELSNSRNKLGRAVIEPVVDETTSKFEKAPIEDHVMEKSKKRRKE